MAEAAAARVPSVGDTANPDELKNDVESYEHLEELAERFFAANRRHPQALQSLAGLNTHSFGLRVTATDVGPFAKRYHVGEDGISLPGKESGLI